MLLERRGTNGLRPLSNIEHKIFISRSKADYSDNNNNNNNHNQGRGGGLRQEGAAETSGQYHDAAIPTS